MAADQAPREDRGTRRRRETRLRLLNAALKLMAQRGMDAVAVNEITEEADVGFGSFYNHFASKEAIHEELTDVVFNEFADAMDAAHASLADPAEVLASSVRHTVYRARRDPIWAYFLLREGLSQRMMTRGLGVRLLRDIQRGIAENRFAADDPLMSFVTLAGTALAAIAVEVQYSSAAASAMPAALRRSLGLPSEDLPERAAAAVLQIVGIPAAEARRISRRKLVELTLPADSIGGS